MKTRLRWYLLFPAALLAWLAMIHLGLSIEAFAKQELCQPIQYESVWHCINDDPVIRRVLEEQLLSSIFFMLSPLPVVFVSAVVAPSHKVIVSWSAWLIGSFVALILAAFPPFLEISLTAIALGFVCAAVATVFYRNHGASVEEPAQA